MPIRNRTAPIVFMAATLAAVAACTGNRQQEGRELYAAHGCAVCHGQTGRGDGPTAHTLTPPPRDFSDPRLYVRGASADAIAASIRGGVGNMPAFKDISSDDADRIAAWIVSLQQAGGKQ